MSNREGKRVSVEDIQLVQNLIERCLQLYMSQKEVVNTLLLQAKIEPGFTELVWQKLEQENPEFFKAYHLRLIAKDQILRFNQLLDRQIELMHQLYPNVVAPIPLSNGSQIHPMHYNSAYHTPELSVHQQCSTITNAYTNGASSLQPTIPNEYTNGASSFQPTIPNAYTNSESSIPPCMPLAVNMAGHVGRTDISADVPLAQRSNSEIVQGMNGGTMIAEASHANHPRFMFGANRNLQQPNTTIGEGSVSSFIDVESNSQALNETFLDQDMNSLGFLGSRNFSFSDLTADFSNNTDILNYSKSPFLGMNSNFPDPHIRGEQDIKRLNTVSEGFSYEDFGSD
ncbi:Hypothetical predicted protein [Olea europaea subsp. europaea]|uniref:Angiotensin-converting enzyme 2 n=2 Tax=Olea europaea subsp. europaea TaxID=158383 RepID=A0A8S0SG01_OLEEU|nr:Hypothetical predicted protein [Olea europaea subsp. europaea]